MSLICKLPAMAALACIATLAIAQTATQKPLKDSSHIEADGTAYVTRVVPVPTTISPEAQRMLARPSSDEAVAQTLQQRREGTDAWQARAGQEFMKLYPVTTKSDLIASVPVRIITPKNATLANQDRVLINLHGGGFNSDSGSLTESVPVANLTGIKVVAVLYRLAPEHPFPAGLEDAVAVYKELLKTYKPQNIGVYGTSAGAILTAELTVKLKQLQLPLPAATAILSGMGDFSQQGDSIALFSLNGFSGHLDPPGSKLADAEYVPVSVDRKDRILSPVYADLSGLPPTLFMTSGRDLLLSGTTILQRAYLRAGVDARLVVFEALPHAFWNNPSLPESREAHQAVATFFKQHLGK